MNEIIKSLRRLIKNLKENRLADGLDQFDKDIDEIEKLSRNYVGIKSRFSRNEDEQPRINEWIPIEERLPDKAGTYLVTYHPRYGDNINENVVAIDVDNFW